MAIHLIAHIRAKAEHLEAVRAVLVGYVEPTRAEAGCRVYDLFQNASDPTHFTFVEEWESQTALDRHAASAHLSAGRVALQGLTRSPTELVEYTRLA